MIKYFRNNGKTAVYNCQNGKIIGTVEIAGRWISNPTIETFVADGWEEFEPQPVQPTRDEMINAAIRERYSSDDEFQLLREVAAGKEGAEQRFAEYNEYVESILVRYE